MIKKVNFMLLFIAIILTEKTAWGAVSQIENVSLIQLIANPQNYDGKIVRVSGFFHNKFEDCNLYLTKEDGDLLRSMNGVAISLSKEVQLYPKDTPLEDADCAQVTLEGTFSKQQISDFSTGTIKNAYRIVLTRSFYDGKKEYKLGNHEIHSK